MGQKSQMGQKSHNAYSYWQQLIVMFYMTCITFMTSMTFMTFMTYSFADSQK